MSKQPVVTRWQVIDDSFLGLNIPTGMLLRHGTASPIYIAGLQFERIDDDSAAWTVMADCESKPAGPITREQYEAMRAMDEEWTEAIERKKESVRAYNVYAHLYCDIAKVLGKSAVDLPPEKLVEKITQLIKQRDEARVELSKVRQYPNMDSLQEKDDCIAKLTAECDRLRAELVGTQKVVYQRDAFIGELSQVADGSLDESVELLDEKGRAALRQKIETMADRLESLKHEHPKIIEERNARDVLIGEIAKEVGGVPEGEAYVKDDRPRKSLLHTIKELSKRADRADDHAATIANLRDSLSEARHEVSRLRKLYEKNGKTIEGLRNHLRSMREKVSRAIGAQLETGGGQYSEQEDDIDGDD